MADDVPKPDSKLVERATQQVITKGAVWAAGILGTALVGVVLASVKFAYDGLSSEIGKLDGIKQELSRLAADVRAANDGVVAINLRMAEFADVRRDLSIMSNRITSLEAVTTHSNEVHIELDRRILRLSEDVSALRALVSRRDRRDDERPAPPADLGNKIPMLWHF